MTPEAKEFIESLLAMDPKERLGANGVHEIQNHKFFKGSCLIAGCQIYNYLYNRH